MRLFPRLATVSLATLVFGLATGLAAYQQTKGDDPKQKQPPVKKKVPKLKVGDPVPTFTNLECVSGKKFSVGDFKEQVLVICINCNH